jgi:uncharacterized protein (DUF1330 family)
MMPAYVIADIDVHDAARYMKYKELAPPSIAAYGGKYLVRGGDVTVLEGEWKPKRFVILEFPSADVAKRWWNSREYAEAKRLRQECATTSMFVVEGV